MTGRRATFSASIGSAVLPPTWQKVSAFAYLIETFEREPMRWRARIKRLDGRNIRVHVPQMEHAAIVTIEDSATADTASGLAQKVIDDGGMI
jgi:hypothetical protein